MNNLQRLELETKGITLDAQELVMYLSEQGLNAYDDYLSDSLSNKKAIYSTSLSILESVANDVTLMKSIKIDDMTVSQFHENLMKRIDQLERKVRTMKSDNNSSNVFMLYR